MKKVLIYLVLVLFSLYSCQKEESISTKMDNPTMDNLKSEIGVWHNIAVDLYLDSNNKSTEVNYEDVQNEIISELTANYPTTFNARTIAELKSNSELQLAKIIRASNAKKSGITKEDLVYNTSLVFDFIGNNGYINQQLADELVQIALAVEAESISEDDLIKKVELLDNLTLNHQEEELIDAFKQVFYASREYWNDCKLKSKEKTLAIIWADAAGTLYGSILTPVWGIIEGAIFSSIAAIN